MLKLFTLKYFHRQFTARTLSTKLGGRRLVWIGMEKTGMNVDKDHILEISCVITDEYLNRVAQNPSLILHQPESVIRLCEKVHLNHYRSGLLNECRQSSLLLTDVQHILLDFLSKYINKGMWPLIGDSAYIDYLFLKKYLPEVNCFLHRIIDVSTVKLLCSSWNPHLSTSSLGNKSKRSCLENVEQNIADLQFYRDKLFKSFKEKSFDQALFTRFD